MIEELTIITSIEHDPATNCLSVETKRLRVDDDGTLYVLETRDDADTRTVMIDGKARTARRIKGVWYLDNDTQKDVNTSQD